MALVAIAIAIGYADTLGHSFHFDDYSSIRDNVTLANPLDWGSVWAFNPSRFVLYESFALNQWITGTMPAGYRLVNLGIHLAASLLVGWIARELASRIDSASRGGRGPDTVGLLAALLFAVHPLATQAVTYLVQRSTSLCASFELAAVALSLQARRSGRTRWWLGAYAAAVLAAFTKESSVALPLILTLVHLAWGGNAPGMEAHRPEASAKPGSRVPWQWLAPFLLVVPFVLWAAHLPKGETGGAWAGLRETSEIGRLEYLFTQLTVIPRYLGLVLWPGSQNLDPDIVLRARPDAAVGAGALLIAMLTLAALSAYRRAPFLALGWLWFLVALAPESSVFPIRDPMVEHRTYLPVAGLAWIASWGLTRLPMRRGVLVTVAVVVVLALGVVTHVRNRVWRDEVSLWSDVVRKSPGLPRGWNNLAMGLGSSGRTSEAEAAYRRAMALDSSYLYARVNLSELYGTSGRFHEALSVLQEAARIAPDEPAVLNNLGTAWWALGDTARALAAYEAALARDPASPDIRSNLERLRAAFRQSPP